MGTSSVAQVLLVASEERQRELAPSLTVTGEPVGYALDVSSSVPSLRPDGMWWDVIIVDGASFRGDECRSRLREAREHEPRSAVLYVCTARPSEVELQAMTLWADDALEAGPDLAQRLQWRVQAIALAPWRRSQALRTRAERLGDGRLRVVQPAPASETGPRASRRLDRALPFVLADHGRVLGDSAAALVAYAFHEGRRVGVASVQESAEDVCRRCLEELTAALFDAREADEAATARFEGASYAVHVIRDQLRWLTRDELAAIDRHGTRSVQEP